MTLWVRAGRAERARSGLARSGLARRAAALAVAVLAACAGKQQPGAVSSGDSTVAASSSAPAMAASRVTGAPVPDKGHSPVRKRVLFVGTSLTAGLGLDPSEAYPALLQAKADSLGLAVEMVNAGMSGETSAGALRRIDWLLRSPADVVVIETGANDGLRALDVDSTRANIDAIVARTQAARPAARVLLVQMEAPPNLGRDYTTRFHDMYPEIARRHNITLVPFLLDRVAGIRSLNQEDGIHPNSQGEKIVAENVWRMLGPAMRS
jgi:acyl-CoA thioesterase-1